MTTPEKGANGKAENPPAKGRRYVAAAATVAAASAGWQLVVEPWRQDWQKACGKEWIGVGDGYCDCIDGRDERLFPTSAPCGEFFECERALSQKYWIRRSRVLDGIDDCCDGSDERKQTPGVCELAARAELERLEIEERRYSEVDRYRETLADNVSTLVAAAKQEIEAVMPYIQRILADTQQTDDARRAYRAHQAYQQAMRQLQPRKDAADANAAVYGHDGAWLTLVGSCFDSPPFSDKHVLGGTSQIDPQAYVFTLCPFHNVSQKPVGGTDRTLLGSYLAWVHGPLSDAETDTTNRTFGDHKLKHRHFAASPNRGSFIQGDARAIDRHIYDGGAPCIGGRSRHVIVDFRCGDHNAVVRVHEDGVCQYVLEFTSPLACEADPIARHLLRRKISKLSSQLRLPQLTITFRLLRIYSLRIARSIFAFLAADPRTILASFP